MANVFDTVFGGDAGLFGPEALAAGRKQGLFDLGLSLLETGGPQRVPVGPGQALARGLRAGREGYQTAAEAVQGAQLQRHRQQVMARYAGRTDPSSLQAMFSELIALGDNEGAKSVAEVLKSMGGSDGSYRIVTGVGPDGRPQLYRVGPSGNPQPLGLGDARTDPGSSLQLKEVRGEDGLPTFALFDPRTGAMSPLSGDYEPNSQPSENERRMSGILELVRPHIEILDSATTAPGRWEQIWRGWQVGELLNEEQQALDVASRAVADAFLRMTTGAAYNDTELRNALTIVTPRPGDRPTTLALKRRVRQAMVTALERMGGRAAAEVLVQGARHIETGGNPGAIGGDFEYPDDDQ